MSEFTTNWQKLEDDDAALLGAHGGEPVVAVRPSLVRALHGNGNAAIMLSQLLYWSRRTDDPEGWFYNKQSAIEEQTGLGSDAQLKARKFLKSLGLIQDKLKGVPPTIYYCVNLAKVAQIIRDHAVVPISGQSRKLNSAQSRNTNSAQSRKLNSGLGRKSYKDTEITTEITTENKCVSTNNVPPRAETTAAPADHQSHTQHPQPVSAFRVPPTAPPTQTGVLTPDRQALLDAVLDLTGKRTKYEIGSVSATWRRSLSTLLSMLEADKRTPADVAAVKDKWPLFLNNSAAQPMTVEQAIDRFDDVFNFVPREKTNGQANGNHNPQHRDSSRFETASERQFREQQEQRRRLADAISKDVARGLITLG